MFTLEELLSIYNYVEEVEMSPQFAYVYSRLVKETNRMFWLGVRKHSLRIWYKKYEKILREDIEIKYKRVEIPKKKGGKRVLHIPGEKLKIRQKAWLEFLYVVFPWGAWAYAFERGRSILDALEVHVGNYLFIKCDIHDAFPSSKREELDCALYNLNVVRGVRKKLLEDCYYKGLPQGAPTSGKLFNLLMKITDGKIAKVIEIVGGKYTRYADDIVISFPKGKRVSINKTTGVVERYLSEIGLRLNRKKTRVFKGTAKLLGCVVHENRVTISRKKRRLYRAMVHNNKTGKVSLSRDKYNGIRGWLNSIYKGVRVPGVEEVTF